jgi:hypothetical protein
MNITYITITAVVAGLIILDFNFVHFFDLQLKRLWLEVRKVPMRLKLEWDIYFMKTDMKKYMRMAEELRKELGVDEAD